MYLVYDLRYFKDLSYNLKEKKPKSKKRLQNPKKNKNYKNEIIPSDVCVLKTLCAKNYVFTPFDLICRWLELIV